MLLKWLATWLRDLLNGYINPNWKADLEQLQQDAAAHQRLHAETEKENAAIEQQVEQGDAEIAASQVQVVNHQQERADRANEKPSSIADILGFSDKP